MKQVHCPGCDTDVAVPESADPGYKFDCEN